MSRNKREAKGDAGVNINVVLRIRPMNGREKKTEGVSEAVVVDGKRTVTIPSGKHQPNFSYNRAYGPDSTQLAVYEEVVSPIIQEVIQGYNCTIFAYGQTGTGKTYTMEGDTPAQFESGMTFRDMPDATGVIPRAVGDIFQSLNASGSEYTVRISHLELYNERLRDLLAEVKDDGTPPKEPKIYANRAAPGRPTVVQGLEEFVVLDPAEVLAHLGRSTERRTTSATDMNARSSRSHCIFSITVHVKETSADGEDVLKIGKLNLVDLAGSESAALSGAVERGNVKQQKEGRAINQSLLTLGKVIRELCQREGHVSYRDSKLTRLLAESLGGRAKTCIVATISPASDCISETLSTLRYAQAAMNVQNTPEVNEKRTKHEVIAEYATEIDRLQQDLAAARRQDGVWLDPARYDELQAEHKTLEGAVAGLVTALDGMKEEFGRVQADLAVTAKEKAAVMGKLEAAEAGLKGARHDLGQEIIVNKELEARNTKLATTAHGVIEQLRGAQDDLGGLFGKLGRASSNEHSNMSRLETTQGRLAAGLEEVLGTVGGVGEVAGEWGAASTGVLRKYQSTADDVTRQMDAAVTDLARTIQATAGGVDAIVQDVVGATRAALETELDATGQLPAAFHEAVAVPLDDIRSTVGAVAGHLDQIRTDACRTRDGAVTLLQDTTAEIRRAAGALSVAATADVGRVASMVSAMDGRGAAVADGRVGLLGRVRAAMADFRGLVAARVDEMITVHEGEVIAMIEDHLKVETDAADATAAETHAVHDDAEARRASNSAMLSDLTALVETGLGRATEAVTQHTDLAAHLTGSVMKAVEDIAATADDVAGQGAVAVQSLTDRVKANCDWTVDLMTQLQESVATHMDSHVGALTGQASALRGLTATGAGATTAAIEALRTVGSEHGEVVKDAAESAGARLDGLLEAVGGLASSFTSLEPTGATPRVHESLGRNVPATSSLPSPVERTAIVNSFREQFGTPSAALSLRRRVGLEPVTPVPSRLHNVSQMDT